MPVNLPTPFLRSFVAIADEGSMLSATEKVFVTQSAISLQVKRLEELVQQQLFVRDGRRLSLTAAGETLLGYARRVLELHDEALRAVGGKGFAGPVRFGTVQDFAETLLTGVLKSFAELHPDSAVFARVAGTAELQELLARGQLDVLVGFSEDQDPKGVRTAGVRWFGEMALPRRDIVPLAVLEKPCRFREAASRSLEAAGIDYRIAVETPNLSTLRAAVAAGLGITARTPLFLRDFAPLESNQLPALPTVACVVETRADRAPAIARLSQLTIEAVAGL